jgi:hypothetical protein
MAGSLSVRKKNAAAAKKRRFEVEQAALRQNQSRAGENMSALGSGIASIPGRVVNYIKTSTPSGVLQDVKDIASSTYNAAAEDPGQFAADAIFSPLAAIRDFGDVRAMARKLREQGRNAEAEKLEAMAGVSVLSAIPVVGKVAGTAVRDAEQAALRGAVKGAARSVIKDIRPSTDDVYKVMEANTTAGKVIGDKMMPINKLNGGVTAAADDARRVDKLVKEMSSPEGYVSRLIVDDVGNVIEGQHRLEALRKMGVSEVPVTQYADLERAVPFSSMRDAAAAQGVHPDQANQIAKQLAEIYADEGGDMAEVMQYSAPKGFEKAWDAAISALPAVEKEAAPLAVKPTVAATPRSAVGAVGEGRAVLGMSDAAKAAKQSSRLERARAQGFNTDVPLYHGTSSDFGVFSPDREIFLSDRPDVANIYAVERGKDKARKYGPTINADPNVRPVFAKMQNPLVVSDLGPDGSHGWSTDNMAAALGIDATSGPKLRGRALHDEARRQGYDIVKIENMADLGGEQSQYIPLHPDYVKSQFDLFETATPKTAKKKAAATPKAPANPLHEVSLEFGPEVARRLDGMIPPDAPISEWREAAARLTGSDIPNSVQPRPSTYSVRPADVATDPRIEKRKGELGKIANLELEVSPRVTDPAPEVSIFDYEGHPYITSMSDLAAAGDDLLSVNGVKFHTPFSRRGGQGYMFDNPGSVWASERKPAETHVDLANRLQQMTGKDVLFMPWTMGPNAVKFSHMPRGIQYSYADAALGGADRNALAADIKSILPDWRGFEDPDSAERFMTVTGNARGALNNLMDKYRNRGGLGEGEAVYAATDLDQMNTPLTTLRNVGIIDPKYGASPSSHASYNFSVPGRGEGVLKEDIGALGLSPDVMAVLGYKTPFDFPVGVQPGTKSPLRAMQMKPQGGVLDYNVLRFLDDLLKGKK